MADETEDPRSLTVLTTEHFALEGVRGTGSGEAASRSALYFATLSSLLIALGFVSGSPDLLVPFFAAGAPIVFVIGILTFLRLVFLGVQDLQRQRDIERIHQWYRTLTPTLAEFYPEVQWRDPRAVIRAMGVRPGPLQLFSTAAAMIAIVDSALAGVGVAFAVWSAGAPYLAVVVGLVVVVVLVIVFLRYQWRVNVRAFSD